MFLDCCSGTNSFLSSLPIPFAIFCPAEVLLVQDGMGCVRLRVKQLGLPHFI